MARVSRWSATPTSCANHRSSRVRRRGTIACRRLTARDPLTDRVRSSRPANRFGRLADVGADASINATIVVVALALLWTARAPPDIVFGGALLALALTRVVTLEAALVRFAKRCVITVGTLHVVVAGLRQTCGLHWLARRLFSASRKLRAASRRLTLPVAMLSPFLDNTPVVAMLIPAMRDGGRASGIPASKLRIPLSYAAILGGTVTLIGTSTSLASDGLVGAQEAGGLGVLELTWLSVPSAIAGLLFLLLIGPRLVPVRSGLRRTLDDPRNYVFEVSVATDCPLVGRTIETAGLRQLSRLHLVEIERDGEFLRVVRPEERSCAGGRLVFAGDVASVVDLQRVRGLLRADDQVFKREGARNRRLLVETVVSETAPVLGHTEREARFLNNYDAVITANACSGKRVKQKLGDVRLRAGNSLLLETRPSVSKRPRESRDLYRISYVADSSPPRFQRALLTVALRAAMVASTALGRLTMLEATLPLAGAMLLTRTLRRDAARAAIEWPGLISIVSAFALGTAMESSGLATTLARPPRHRSVRPPPRHLVRGLPRQRRLQRNRDQQGHRRPDLPHSVGSRRGDQRLTRPSCDHRHDGAFGQLRHPHRVPDQPDGVRPGRLPLRRLRPNRRPHDRRHCNRHTARHSVGVAAVIRPPLLAEPLAARLACLVRDSSIAPCPTAFGDDVDVTATHQPLEFA